MFRKAIVVFFLYISSFVIISSICFAVGIKPLSVDIPARPGQTVQFSFDLLPSEVSERILISVSRIIQNSDGQLIYEDVDAKSYPPAGWISFPNSFTVNPGPDHKVNVTIKVPYDAGGTYPLALIVGPDVKSIGKGFNFQIKYALRLNLRVERSGLRPTAVISNFLMNKDDKSLPLIDAYIKNTSQVDYLASAEVTIRDSNRHLVERLFLKTKSKLSYKTADIEFQPGVELHLMGMPRETLHPGFYEIKMIFRYGSGGQIVKTIEHNVKEGDYKYPAFQMMSLRLRQDELVFEGKPGTVVSKPLVIENRSKNPLRVNLATETIQPKYPFSIFQRMEVDIKGDKIFDIGPNRVVTKVISVRIPKDAIPQSNYGYVKLLVSTFDNKPLEEHSALLIGQTSNSFNRLATVKYLTFERNSETGNCEITVVNNGLTRITPSLSIVVRTELGTVVQNIRIGPNLVNGEQESLLPLMQTTFESILKDLKKEKYLIQVDVLDNYSTVGSSVFELDLKAENNIIEGVAKPNAS